MPDARERTKEDVPSDGGCKWKGEVLENGAVWHPNVLPYGQINCVICNCKDGATDCKRKDCPVLSCRDQVQDKEACCPRCAVTGAEVTIEMIETVSQTNFLFLI